VAARTPITTNLASHDLHNIWVRGHNLTESVMGHSTFSDVVYLLIAGRFPDEQERRLVDAMLVSLMEHGLTPSAVVARMTYAVAPEAIQGAVAAGLLGAGSVVLGSMEECGRLLTRVTEEVDAGADRDVAIRAIVNEYRASGRKLPGVGHIIHRDGDPRAARLFVLADECGKHGQYVDALHQLVELATPASGRRLPINVTGAVAALLLELGVPWRMHRGFALISRSVGLVAHIGEELTDPITPSLRQVITEDSEMANGAAE
jgi:citrate synthase